MKYSGIVVFIAGLAILVGSMVGHAKLDNSMLDEIHTKNLELQRVYVSKINLDMECIALEQEKRRLQNIAAQYALENIALRKKYNFWGKIQYTPTSAKDTEK